MVTGAAGGIGAVVAREMVNQGASVVLLDLDLSKCTELAANLSEQSGAQVTALACDISDPHSVRQAGAQVQERYGRCDILINNASVLRPASLENITLEQWNPGTLKDLSVVWKNASAHHSWRNSTTSDFDDNRLFISYPVSLL